MAVQRARNGVLWGWLGALEVTGNVTIRYSFLFHFNRNHASILYRFRDIASYLSKVDYNLPHPHLALPLVVTTVEFR